MSLYGVIDYHVTLSEGHIIANHPYKETLVPHLVATLIYLSQNYSYYIRGDRSPVRLISYNVFTTEVHMFCKAPWAAIDWMCVN